MSETSMSIPSPCTPITQGSSPTEKADREDDPLSFRRDEVLLGIYQKQLWHEVRRHLENAESFLSFGFLGKDAAMNHLALTRKFCDKFKATEPMYRACQDTEDIIRCWPASAANVRPRRLRRRHSASRVQQSPGIGYQSVEHVDSPEDLYNFLMGQVAKSPRTPSSQKQAVHSSPSHASPSPVAEYTRQCAASSDSNAKSEDGFVPIELVLPRLRQGGNLKEQRPPPAALSHNVDGMHPATMQLSSGWDAQLPNSPSNFKDSEEPSPRRHSFPYASPHASGSPVVRKARKASMHSPPQPLIGNEPRSQPNAPASAWGSASNYSRRPSQDETSTVLSDTPSLTKLARQVHTNPFTETQSLVSSRVRKLSIEDPTSEALGTEKASVSEHPDTPPGSPLRQTYTPEDLQPAPVLGPSSPRSPLGRKGPPPLALNTLSRQSGSPSSAQISPSSSPHIPSPLRTEFSASECVPAPQDAASPLHEGLRRQPSSSRIPRPMRRSSRSSNPASPISATHESRLPSSNNRLSPSAMPNHTGSDHPPSSPTTSNSAARIPVRTLIPTPPSPSTSTSIATTTATATATAATATAAAAAANPPPISHRRRTTASLVSRMAAQFERKSPSSGGPPIRGGSGNGGGAAAVSAARPRWQMPGRTKTGGGPGTKTSEQAGFVKWGREMVQRKPASGDGSGSGSVSGAGRGGQE